MTTLAQTERSFIPSEFFTACPYPNTSWQLSQIYRKGIKSWALSHVESLAKHTAVKSQRLRDVVTNLDVERKWSPAVYFALTHLGEACYQVDVTACWDAIAQIENLTEGAVYDATPRVSSILTEPWEPPFVSHMREFEPLDEFGRKSRSYPLLQEELEPHKKPMATALDRMQEIDPEVWEEYESYATRIKLFKGIGLSGETNNHVFGAIWLCVPPRTFHQVSYWIEHLVHEVSHLQLLALGIHDKLVLNPNSERFPAPIRDDARPMYGILHATFVLSRMVRTFRRLVREETDPAYGKSLERISAQFEKGVSILNSDRAKLTPAAQRIRESLTVCAYDSN